MEKNHTEEQIFLFLLSASALDTCKCCRSVILQPIRKQHLKALLEFVSSSNQTEIRLREVKACVSDQPQEGETHSTRAPDELKIRILPCKSLIQKWINVNTQHRKYSGSCRVCNGRYTCHWHEIWRSHPNSEDSLSKFALKKNSIFFFQPAPCIYRSIK